MKVDQKSLPTEPNLGSYPVYNVRSFSAPAMIFPPHHQTLPSLPLVSFPLALPLPSSLPDPHATSTEGIVKNLASLCHLTG